MSPEGIKCVADVSGTLFFWRLSFNIWRISLAESIEIFFRQALCSRPSETQNSLVFSCAKMSLIIVPRIL